MQVIFSLTYGAGHNSWTTVAFLSVTVIVVVVVVVVVIISIISTAAAVGVVVDDDFAINLK